MKDLLELIEQLEAEDLTETTYEERQNKLRQYSDRFEELQHQCYTQIQRGVDLDVETIAERLKAAIEKRKALHELTSPKYINLAYMLSTMLAKLKKLSYLLDKDLQEVACNCQIRLQHSMPPEVVYLKKIGHCLDWVGEVINIMQCDNCETKWIKYNAGGIGIIIDRWKEWDPKAFPLKA